MAYLGLDLQKLLKKGNYDPDTKGGEIARLVAKDELIERLVELEGHPAISSALDVNKETILLRNTVNDKKILIDYEDTLITERSRDNLNVINSCLQRHWCDLEILDAEVPKLEQRFKNHKTKEPIDFTKRALVRIFSNGSFKEGGRFYRG